eukprot:NODE_85_length_22232_cov_1.318619.p5 type:complete len:323 gc:universal NODE_85_length_22232_cov_1.318619:3118-2150(-)
MSLDTIPDEIIVAISLLCSVHEQSTLSRSKKSLSLLLNNEYLWKQRFRREYELDMNLKSISTWRLLYKLYHLTERNWKKGNFKSSKFYYENNGVVQNTSQFNINRSLHLCIDEKSKLVVSLSENGQANVWNLKNNRNIASLRHDEKITTSSIENNYIATADKIGVIKLWKCSDFTVKEFAASRNEISCIKLKGNIIAAGNEVGELILIETNNDLVHIIQTSRLPISCIDVSSSYVAVGGLDCKLRIYNALNWQLITSVSIPSTLYCISMIRNDIFVGHYSGLTQIDLLGKKLSRWNENATVLTIKASDKKVIVSHQGRLWDL